MSTRKEYDAAWYQNNKEKKLKKGKEWKKNNPDKVAVISRRRTLKTKFQLTIEEYNQKLKEQNFCCAICKIHHESSKLQLAVDHDHGTGKIRDLLCGNCNRGLGFFKDSAEILSLAIQYLKKHKI